MIDRHNDAADIVTATVGVGLGGQARVGPVHAGLGMFLETKGLRGGAYQDRSLEECSMDWDGGIFPAFGPAGHGSAFTMSGFTATNDALRRGKAYGAISAIPFITTAVHEFTEDDNSADMRDPAPITRHTLPYYTQVEVFVAIIGGTRIGLNPGEFLDFVLGLIGIDIFDDDIRSRRLTTESTPALNTEQRASDN